MDKKLKHFITSPFLEMNQIHFQSKGKTLNLLDSVLYNCINKVFCEMLSVHIFNHLCCVHTRLNYSHWNQMKPAELLFLHYSESLYMANS